MSSIDQVVGRIPRQNQRHMVIKYVNMANHFVGLNLDRADIMLQGQAIVINTRDYAEGNRLHVLEEMAHFKEQNDEHNTGEKRYLIDDMIYDDFLKKEVMKEVDRKEFLRAVRKREKELGYKITYTYRDELNQLQGIY